MADMKCRVNIPRALYEPLPLVSPIVSVSHNPPGDSTGTGLVLHSLIDFYCGMYFILCRKETESVHATCSAMQGKSWRWDQDSHLLLVEEEIDFLQERVVTEQGRMDSK